MRGNLTLKNTKKERVSFYRFLQKNNFLKKLKVIILKYSLNIEQYPDSKNLRQIQRFLFWITTVFQKYLLLLGYGQYQYLGHLLGNTGIPNTQSTRPLLLCFR